MERRRPHPPLRIPITLPVRLGAHGSSYDETALNVSTGGMFIRTARYLRPGSDVQLEFELSPHDRTTATGKVVWVSEGVQGNQVSFARGLGIQFTYLPIAAKNQISRLSAEFRTFP